MNATKMGMFTKDSSTLEKLMDKVSILGKLHQKSMMVNGSEESDKGTAFGRI